MTKSQFIKTENAKRFASIAAGMDFETACDTAFLAYMEELGEAKDAQDAAAKNWKREGAKRFLRILQQIATPEEPAKAERWPEMVKT